MVDGKRVSVTLDVDLIACLDELAERYKRPRTNIVQQLLKTGVAYATFWGKRQEDSSPELQHIREEVAGWHEFLSTMGGGTVGWDWRPPVIGMNFGGRAQWNVTPDPGYTTIA